MSFLVVGLGGAFGGNAAWGMQPLGIAFAGQWWRLFSAIFMHAGVLHLGFNMYMLFMLGTPLERLLGRGHFLILFLLSGLGGSVASYVFSDIGTLSVGASGAVFGLMSASIVFSRRLHSEANQLLGLLIANVALGFLLPGIDWRAHLGGAAAGATVGWVLSTGGTTATVRTSRRQTMGLCVFVLLQFAIVLWRSQQLQSL